MRWVAVVALVGLAGCSSAGKDAEERYDIVAKSGDARAKCNAAKDVQAGYLADHNDGEYREWGRRADTDCAIARLGDFATRPAATADGGNR